MMRALWVLACLLPAAAQAMTVFPLTLKDLAQKSDAIYVGKCVGAQSYFVTLTAERERIYTNYLLQVDETIKGRETKTVIITERGGQVGAVLQWIPGLPMYATGEEVVVFAYKTKDGLTTKGCAQGKYMINANPTTGKKTVDRNLSGLLFMDEKMTKELERPKDPPGTTLEDFLEQVRKYAGKKSKER